MNRITLLAIVLLAILAAYLSLRTRVEDGGTPGWDSASHGVQGFALAQDIQRFDVVNFAADALGHRYRYPPGHPMVLAGAFLIFGPTWWTAFGLSALLFAALAVVLYVTAESKVAGWISALLALTCPALLALSGMIMLEMPAAILMTLSLRLYARSLEDDAAVCPLGWTLTVFMLTAAQYAACAIATLMAFELWRSRTWVRDSLSRFARSRALFHPLHVLIAMAILTAIAIRLTGGWSFAIGSRTLSMTRAGGPLIAAALLTGVRVAWLCWKHREALRASVPRRYRDIFVTGIIPIYVWVFVIYPPRFQQFAEWVSRPPEVHARTDPAHWSFYPEYFLKGGHVALWVALGIVALVIASFLRRGKPERVRFYQWAVIAGAVLVLGHHARQSRFIVPFLVAWWILASETIVTFLPKFRTIVGAIATLVIVVPAAHLYRSDLPGVVSPPPYHRDYADVLRWTIDRIGDVPSIRVIGGIDGLSRHLFEWELRKRFDLRSRKLRFNLDEPPDRDSGPRNVYDAWVGGDSESLVVAIEPSGLSRGGRSLIYPNWPEYPNPLDWPHHTMLFLREETRYEELHKLEFAAARLCVRIYRRRP